MEQIIKKMIDDGILKPSEVDNQPPITEATPKKK
jgi:hypothetical protein